MAQQQQNISVRAPGFQGLNTQDSPIEMDHSFASQADNCVIDRYGRIAARKGFVQITSNPEVLNEQRIEALFEFVDDEGEVYLFACGNNQIYRQDITGVTGTLTAMTLPLSYTISANNWQIISFGGKCYFVQGGQAPLVFDPLGFSHAASETELYLWLEDWGDLDSPLNGVGFPNCVTAAFGQLIVGDFDNDKSTAAWSNLADGESWAAASPTGGAGAIDLTEFWPFGYDRLTAIRAHNNFQIYFGERSILIYSVPDTGYNDQALVDTVEGLGCVARDTVVPTGTDLYFLDATGVRSFARTVQEKSMAIGDISYNVRNDIQSALQTNPSTNIKAVYHPEDSFYCVFFPTSFQTYVFDTRILMEGYKARVTNWLNLAPGCAVRSREKKTWFAGRWGVYEYTGQNDTALTDADGYTTPIVAPVTIAYYTQPLTFGDPVRVKLPKQVDVTTIGGTNIDMTLDWAFDYRSTYFEILKSFSSANFGTYNEDSEYNEGVEYGGDEDITRTVYNIWGQGTNVKVGFRVNTNGSAFSIQELNIQTLLGRIL